MAMVISMSMAWSPVGNVYSASDDGSDDAHDPRRAFLRESMARVCAPDR
jgi:hypothetical protein